MFLLRVQRGYDGRTSTVSINSGADLHNTYAKSSLGTGFVGSLTGTVHKPGDETSVGRLRKNAKSLGYYGQSLLGDALNEIRKTPPLRRRFSLVAPAFLLGESRTRWRDFFDETFANIFREFPSINTRLSEIVQLITFEALFANI